MRDCARRIVCNGDQITRKRSGKFHFDLVRFFRAALAPFLPRPCESFSADAQSFSFAVQQLSGDAFVCSLLSSRQPNAIVESVAAPRASRVSTVPALMLTGGSRA
jgi:hypothetical protein